FDHYGIILNIAVPWSFLICFWHAMHALIYPVLTIYFLFPAHANENWIGKKTAITISAITLIFALLTFFSNNSDAPSGTLPSLVIFVVVSVILFWLSSLLPAAPTIIPGGLFTWKPLVYGLVFFIAAFFIPLILARLQIPVFLFALYFFVL